MNAKKESASNSNVIVCSVEVRLVSSQYYLQLDILKLLFSPYQLDAVKLC